ncbi:phospholipase D family protein [Mucilaginibacter gotjawali]|uniref:Uncharacterized protein n=2 Tax=Mucilaginibacter gotjawali TaxID=1550579 RepID=A0A839SIR8_9SPHI|nr:phospholipase D family protein [Mucilaginibacter gotjawali]MBB3057736.1 hypothetical protein [Mucilaginibacter gotjawali]BAU52539.1 hypothetical protein MgSA37_00701 [Mucilaginibacter gotjawali]
MAQFKSGSALNAQLEKLIGEADKVLWLISPYIKLHNKIIAELKQKASNPELSVIVLFGKGDDGVNKLSYEDATFFKTFANIEIRHEKNLHAKYYANEHGGMIASMNLYEFSHNNNIECGVWLDTPGAAERLIGLSKDAEVDDDSTKFFLRVIKNSELLFKREPEFESGLISILKKKYKGSITKVDKLDAYIKADEKKKESSFSGFKNYGETNSNKSAASPAYKSNEYQRGNNTYNQSRNNNDAFASPKGYCIRTGVEIPFNPERPFCYDAYNTWSQFSNYDYPEKYCHKTGRLTNGKTSFRNPIL